MKYLMTQSLLSSYLYLFKVDDEYLDKSYEEFLDTLRGIKSPPNKAMQIGIDFEDTVELLVKGENPDNVNDAHIQIANIVTGGVTQARLSADLQVDGIDYLLYGRLDWLKAAVIYDIKRINTSGRSPYKTGKFTDSIQHPFYFTICPEATRFEYLIFDGKDVFIEAYNRNEQISAPEQQVTMIIREFMQFLRQRGLEQIYFDNWKSKED